MTNAGAGASALCECVSLCDCMFCVARVCPGTRVPLLSVSHCALSSSSRTADWIRLAWIIPNSQCSTEFLHRADHSFTCHFLNTHAAQSPTTAIYFSTNDLVCKMPKLLNNTKNCLALSTGAQDDAFKLLFFLTSSPKHKYIKCKMIQITKKTASLTF